MINLLLDSTQVAQITHKCRQFCHTFCFNFVLLIKANETTTNVNAAITPVGEQKPYGTATRDNRKFIESSL